MRNYLYYTYQYYNPRHPKADDLGFVHSVFGYIVHRLKVAYRLYGQRRKEKKT